MMRATRLLMTLLLLFLMPLGAQAACSFSSGKNTSVTFNFSSSNITVAAGTPDGTILASSPQATPQNPPVMQCGFLFFTESVNYGVVNSLGGYKADNYTYETGIPGVGYRIIHPAAYLTSYPNNSEDLGTATFTVTSALQLIKTGPITSGSVLAAGKLADWRWGSLIPETFMLGNPITFTTPSCTIDTSPINVILPTVTTSAFTGVGSTLGKTPFNIQLNCPAGTAVTKITMHTAAADSHPGVVAPSGAGYAAGIGVQVLDGNSNPMVFETQTVVTPPNATTSIPYFAQYFQTASAVTGGAVKATVTFDIFYQ